MLRSTELDRENQSTVCNQNKGKFLVFVSRFVSVLFFLKGYNCENRESELKRELL